ncbi:MAG TPA: glycosyltransferase family 39 protein [Verrucomicrobiae bacterium]|nr:glycosyltransferase family 39 protein [Verrucomicrobiae bacterium]
MKKTLVVLGLAAAALLLFFYKSNEIPLWSQDEGRHGEIAREMFERRELVVPSFNYVDYLEKPPFAFLPNAAAYVLFGVSSVSARLPAIAAALLGLLLTYFFARRFFSGSAAGHSAVILATSVGYVLVGRFAVIDMVLTLWLSCAIFFLMAACFEQKRHLYLPAYFFMGLAVLTKGLIGIVLPGLIFLAFLVWTRRLGEILKMHIPWGILIVTATALPCFLAVWRREPEFFEVFFLKHQFARFATKTFGRVRPFWFFVPILFGVAFPWSLFIPAGVVSGLKSGEFPRDKVKFLIAWILGVFVFFSIPRSKLPYYILPLSVPLAMLLGLFFSSLSSGNASALVVKAAKRTWASLLAVSAAGAAGLALYALLGDLDETARALKPLLFAGSVFVLMLFPAAWLGFKGRFKAAFAGTAVIVYGVLMTTFVGMKTLNPFESTYEEARLIEPLLGTDGVAAVFASPDTFSDFPFHLRRRVAVIGDNRGTLTQESEEPENEADSKKWFMSADAMSRIFNEGGKRMFCLMKEDQFEVLKGSGLKKYEVLSHAYGKMLIRTVD